MKYAGAISIYDNNGQEVWGRDLTQEEIIDAILSKPPASEEEVEETPAPRKKKEPKCSICGRGGHNVMTCPKGTGLHPNNPRKKGQKVCKICGTPGHLAKTCSKGNSRGLPNADTRKEVEENSALSPEIRERIKDMREKDMTSTEIARELFAELDMDFEAMKVEVQKVTPRGADKYNAKKEEETAAETRVEPLTPEQYADVRSAMNDREFQSAQYSLVNKLRPSEVNAAIKSDNYQSYLDGRA